MIETTLVRGSVEVRSGRRHAMLEPGQQARVGREGAVFDVRPVAAEDYAAWTRGLFTFNEEPLASICRKLSRWYGVEIVPQGAEAGQMRYTGIVKRYETFAERPACWNGPTRYARRSGTKRSYFASTVTTVDAG